MTTDKKYNGWTNYETWRIALELFGGYDPSEECEHTQAADTDELTDELADSLRGQAEEYISTSASGLALDLAMSFLQAVDWREIASHMVEDYADRIPEHVERV